MPIDSPIPPDQPTPLPGPPGRHGAGRPGDAVLLVAARPTPSRCGRTTGAASCSGCPGGPSHLDIWDLKPDSEKNGGPFRPIDTSAPGVKISEHLPKVAKQMHHLNIIRSLDSKEGNHDRGTYLMHTGYVPNPTVVHPGWGSVCAYELGEQREELRPAALRRDQRARDGGRLPGHVVLAVRGPEPERRRSPTSSRPATSIDMRLERRLQMLEPGRERLHRPAQEPDGRRSQGGLQQDHPDDELAAYKDSSTSTTEPADVREAYGKGSFGSGCLMARRLVEQGVTYVEVSLGGWDTHTNNFDTLSKRLLPELDKGMGALVADLAQRGLLDTHARSSGWASSAGRRGSTRTPAATTGREAGRSSMGGGGMKGGQVVGATDKDGVDIVDRPVGVMDLIATMTKAMGIDVDTQYTTPRGRPMKVVDGGKPINELVG